MASARRRRPGWRTLTLSEWMRSGSQGRRLVRVVALLTALSLIIPGTAFAIVLASYLFLPLPTALPKERGTAASQISVVYAADGSVRVEIDPSGAGNWTAERR